MWTKIVDNELVILQTLREYYKKIGSNKVRRAHLKKLCDDKLSPDHKNVIANATFDRCLARLERAQILQSIKYKDRKLTIIIFSISVVNSFLKRKENTNIEFRKLTEEIDQETWEEMFDELARKLLSRVTSGWSSLGNDDAVYANKVAQEAMVAMVGLIMSRSLEVFTNHVSLNELIPKRKGAIKDLIMALGPFTYDNQNEPFKITIQFNGFQPTMDKISNELFYPIMRKIIPWYLIFSRRVLKYEFSSKDMNFLKNNKIESLSPSARRCFDIFLQNHLGTLIPKSAYNTS